MKLLVFAVLLVIAVSVFFWSIQETSQLIRSTSDVVTPQTPGSHNESTLLPAGNQPDSLPEEITAISQPGHIEQAIVQENTEAIPQQVNKIRAVNGDEVGEFAQPTPETYSAKDAEKYFIPKNQRMPGNLGGPPPLPGFFAVEESGAAIPATVFPVPPPQ